MTALNITNELKHDVPDNGCKIPIKIKYEVDESDVSQRENETRVYERDQNESRWSQDNIHFTGEFSNYYDDKFEIAEQLEWITSSSEILISDTKDEREKLDTNNHRTDGNKYYNCCMCGKSVQNLKLHMEKHTGDKPLQCSHCDRRFAILGCLTRHQMLHYEEKSFVCSVCGTCFRNKYDLSQHSKLHTGKSFDCSYCGKLLGNHVRINTDKKPFLCHVCGVSFKQEWNLSMHIKTHNGEGPFESSVREECIPDRKHLQKHSRTHFGEKPFTCTTCEKSFTNRSSFINHLPVHSNFKSYVCKFCNKAFKRSINLKTHTKIHTGEKPFECAICKKVFSMKCNLKKHLGRIHYAN